MSISHITSIRNKQQSGVTNSQIQHMLQDCFYVNELPKELQDCLYFRALRYWSGKFIIEQMKYGMIWYMDKNYHVEFSSGLGSGSKLSRGSIIAADLNTQYALSFRRALPELNLINYVIIKDTNFQTKGN